MPAWSTLILFAVAVSLLVFTPGPNVLYIIARSAGNLLRGNLKFLRAQRYFAGSVYIGLGVTTALTGTGKK
ncbi:MAG: hypothetical protein ACREEM_13190 [Blastocatellia bacterium]